MAITELDPHVQPQSGSRVSGTRSRAVSLWLLLLLAAYLALSAGYSLTLPTIEVPDEGGHVEYALYLAAVRRFPPLPSTRFEAHQPPLYYLLEAPIAFLIGYNEPSTFPRHTPPDPLALPANPTGPLAGGQDPRHFLHTEADVFPYAGYARAVHLMRLVSVLLGAGVVVATYRLALLLFPGDRARAGLAAALVACLPYFDLLAGAVTNDNLANLLGALVVLQVARVLVVPGWRAHRWLYLGLVLGLGLVTKQSLLAFVPFAGLALLLAVPEWRRRGVGVLALVGGMLVPAGWYLARNLYLYREPLPLAVQRAHLQALHQTIHREFHGIGQVWRYLQETAVFLHDTFWGLFGIYNVPLPRVLYAAYDGLVLLAAVGLVRLAYRAWRRRGWSRSRTAFLVLGLMIPAQLAAIGYRDQDYFGAQGRFLYVVLPAIGLLVATGLLAHFRGRGRAWAAGGVSAALALAGAWVLVGIVAPVYAAPQAPLPTRAALYLGEGATAGQSFQARSGGLSWVEVRLGTYFGRARGPVTLHLQAAPGASAVLATSTLDAAEVPDNEFARFSFPPLVDSAGRTFYFSLAASEPAPSLAPAVWALWSAPAEAIQRYSDGRPAAGSLDFRPGYR